MKKVANVNGSHGISRLLKASKLSTCPTELDILQKVSNESD